MSLKAYVLFCPPDEADAIVLANSPEEAAKLLGAQLRERIVDRVYDIVFPVQLFNPPPIGSEEERMRDGMWHYYLYATDGRRIVFLLHLEEEAELIMRLHERPILVSDGVKGGVL